MVIHCSSVASLAMPSLEGAAVSVIINLGRRKQLLKTNQKQLL
jgi:hypothetical protein